MITKNKQIEDLCNLINTELKLKNQKISFYLIGGGALMFYGAKVSTKDLDIILKDDVNCNLTKQILEKTGFIPIQIEPEYENFELEFIFIKDKYRLDIFKKFVCGKLRLSKDMIQRSKIQLKLSNLTLNILSLEDIFVFKSITQREGDIEDSSEIVKKGVDWDLILKEIKNQIKESKIEVWITFLNERLDILEERYNIQSPIKKEVEKLSEEFYIKLEKIYT
ncbi:MAG: DUF6036 family nucleotidyltransferase [Nanoarchaeota archaeon]